MRQLHPVFNVVKLSAAPEDPILGRKLQAPPPPIVVDGEEEWEVEEILDSRWHRRRFQFLVKRKGFSREHNSWEVASNVKAPDLVVEYYRKHPAAPRHICRIDFDAIFQPRNHCFETQQPWRGDVRATGHKTPGESSVILQSTIMIQLTSRRILRD